MIAMPMLDKPTPFYAFKQSKEEQKVLAEIYKLIAKASEESVYTPAA